MRNTQTDEQDQQKPFNYCGYFFSILLLSATYVLFREEIPNSGDGKDLNPEDAFTFFGVGSENGNVQKSS
jgi:hypothetical protein